MWWCRCFWRWQAYIPKTLDAVIDAERDIARIRQMQQQSSSGEARSGTMAQAGAEGASTHGAAASAGGNGSEMYYTSLVGLTGDLSVRQRSGLIESIAKSADQGTQGEGTGGDGHEEEQDEDEDDDEDDEDEDEDEDDEGEGEEGSEDAAALRKRGK